jgi:hypothetical protein
MFFRSIKLFSVVAGFILISSNIYSQEDRIPVKDEYVKKLPANFTHHLDFGAGLGLDYGGILGIQVGYAPVKHLTLFAAGGYYYFEFGWNLGIKGLIIPKTTKHIFRPFFKAMYGCNSVISVSGIDEYDKVYKGFSVGTGFELRFGKKKKNGFDIDINIPLRTPDFWEDYNTMKNDPRLEVTQGPIPFGISMGYHHEF